MAILNSGCPDGRSLQKMYARLPYGNYIFQAEIYDTDRVLASVELPFEILSPWYLSYWAVGSYILIGLCLLAFVAISCLPFCEEKERTV